jgi:phospholipid/cholesterol/gamma-HCH transport system ATP-binding protein
VIERILLSTSIPLIELRNITQQFGSQTVLRNFSLSVHAGETLVVIGESGCGKSVTTKLMAGLLQPTQGEVFWNGVPVRSLSAQQLQRERLKLGYLFQSGALFDSMNVFDNIAFGLRQNFKLRPREIQEIVAERLGDVGMRMDAAKKMPSQLSGGMRKRVALARALAINPQIIMYDEPTTGLDPIMTDVINHLIIRAREQQHVTSIVVTHEMSTVRKTADRVVMMSALNRVPRDASQILFDGSRDDLFASEEESISEFVNGRADRRLLELAG